MSFNLIYKGSELPNMREDLSPTSIARGYHPQGLTGYEYRYWFLHNSIPSSSTPSLRHASHSIYKSQLLSTAKIKLKKVFLEDLNDPLMLKQINN